MSKLFICNPKNGMILYQPAGLYDVCWWFIHTYPEDIYVKKTEVTQMRELAKKILNKRKTQTVELSDEDLKIFGLEKSDIENDEKEA